MRNFSSKAEHYRTLAVKYHELAKVAQLAYLGDLYRNVAVRYVFMAQETSERAKKEVRSPGNGARMAVGTHAGSGKTSNCSLCGPATDCARKDQNKRTRGWRSHKWAVSLRDAVTNGISPAASGRTSHRLCESP
jgi:hypothetical protein